MEQATPLIVIAAGGAGSRMGGNKPACLLHGRPLIDHLRAWAGRQGGPVRLAVRPGDGDWGTGLPLLVDRDAGLGPISALASGMEAAAALGCGTVLLVGCDMPFLPEDLGERLALALPGHGAALPLSCGRLQPMAGLWRADAARLAQWMAGGGRSLWRWAQAAGVALVPWDGPGHPFANINDRAQLEAAHRRAP